MTTATLHDSLPHWDMTPVYPGLESPEFAQGCAEIVAAIAQLVALFDTHQVAEKPAVPLDDATVQAFEAVLTQYNATLMQSRTIFTYLNCLVSVNTRDTLAQARLSELQQHYVPLWKLNPRFTAWIGSLDVEALLKRSALARDHAFALRKAKLRAAHLMAPTEEALASDFALTGSAAWGKLYSDFTSQIMVPFAREGKTEDLPISKIRNLAFDSDRALRRRAHEAELAAWERAALPIAAALNSIKGETNMLSARRRWETPLEATLLANSIDRPTFDAMMQAAHESFPDFRRYLRAKACALGLEKLAWYDLFAPVGKSDRIWGYAEGRAFIIENFGKYSQKLSDFAARAFRENWIDAEPRSGKTGGAYCAGLRSDESRILSNYNYAFGGVTTLAHELGHAYHNLCAASRTFLQRSTPMTLSETASIFCETIITQAALQQADAPEQLEILEESLQGSCQVVVDITSRFLFEQSVLEARQQRELSVEEFNNLMLDAQRQTYGDGLDENALHNFMWAAKPHYYGPTFYNYPYMFGLLFGLGLYARYQQEPEAFQAGYDELLASTGMADAATMANRFGIDITTVAFWRSSLDVIREQIGEFERLAK